MSDVQSSRTHPLRIGIVAGEISGDILGAGFIQAIQVKYPNAEFVGIGGEAMKAKGMKSLYELEELAVMGLVEVLSRLPRLLKIKRELVQYFKESPPDVFVGIDAPDFNLRLEKSLKDLGIKTVHYVSPSVWAWRPGRIHGIAAATDLVLALFPFEKAFYDRFDVPCRLVGHTLADQIELETPSETVRNQLNLLQDATYLAVLPGSRRGEMARLAPIFIETCQRLAKQFPDLKFLVALVNAGRRAQFESIWQNIAPELEFILVDGTARSVLAASNAVLLASGTVALEAMLIKRPMVVTYKVNALTAWIFKRMSIIPFVSLPNILAGEAIVPELLQDDCQPETLAKAVETMLTQEHQVLMARFHELHLSIRCGADTAAANAVLELLEHKA